MSEYKIVLTLLFVIFAGGILISAKLKDENRKKWWLPLVICISVIVVYIMLVLGTIFAIKNSYRIV